MAQAPAFTQQPVSLYVPQSGQYNSTVEVTSDSEANIEWNTDIFTQLQGSGASTSTSRENNIYSRTDTFTVGADAATTVNYAYEATNSAGTTTSNTVRVTVLDPFFANMTNLGGGYFTDSVLGTLFQQTSPFAFQQQLGWFALSNDNRPGFTWLYPLEYDIGWLYYGFFNYPWMYSNTFNSWVYFVYNADPVVRSFYIQSEDRWINY